MVAGTVDILHSMACKRIVIHNVKSSHKYVGSILEKNLNFMLRYVSIFWGN